MSCCCRICGVRGCCDELHAQSLLLADTRRLVAAAAGDCRDVSAEAEAAACHHALYAAVASVGAGPGGECAVPEAAQQPLDVAAAPVSHIADPGVHATGDGTGIHI